MGNGYTGKVLIVDLTERKIETLEPDEDQYKSFLGGFGLGVRLLFDLNSLIPQIQHRGINLKSVRSGALMLYKNLIPLIILILFRLLITTDVEAKTSRTFYPDGPYEVGVAVKYVKSEDSDFPVTIP